MSAQTSSQMSDRDHSGTLTSPVNVPTVKKRESGEMLALQRDRIGMRAAHVSQMSSFHLTEACTYMLLLIFLVSTVANSSPCMLKSDTSVSAVARVRGIMKVSSSDHVCYAVKCTKRRGKRGVLTRL